MITGPATCSFRPRTRLHVARHIRWLDTLFGLVFDRRGLTGFSYECELNGRLVLDTTSVVQVNIIPTTVEVPLWCRLGSAGCPL